MWPNNEDDLIVGPDTGMKKVRVETRINLVSTRTHKNIIPAASYSPTRSLVQYHRRWKA